MSAILPAVSTRTGDHRRVPAELLAVVRVEPAKLVADPSKELKSFRVALSSSLGAKRGRGRGSFIDSMLDAVDTFYGDVLQYLKAWSAAPPKLREDPEPIRPVALSSTALSSQDGAEQPPDAPVGKQPSTEVTPASGGQEPSTGG